ncbi:MAG: glycosyltransferase family 8 protein [Bacteroidales bacterium]|nr:glycosyltransferase family 8 protein [Bacteroidales bacterium]
MHILCSTDNNYIQHLGVMLVSLLENCHKQKPTEIAIIDDNVSLQNIDKLKDSLHKYKVPIRFIQFQNETLSHLKPKNNKTLAAFHRIFISDFYPAEVDRVLYLDCDIIVRKDIAALYNSELSNYTVAAVQNDGLYYQEQIGMPKESMFFNSGVLLINLSRWRKLGIQQKLITYINENFEKMHRNDQDALNAVLFNDCLLLNPTWNVHLYFFTSPHLCETNKKELIQTIADPSLLHFTTQNKPWFYQTSHPFKQEYYKYLKKTAWKDYRPVDKTFRNILMKNSKIISGYFHKKYKVVKRITKNILVNRNGKSG